MDTLNTSISAYKQIVRYGVFRKLLVASIFPLFSAPPPPLGILWNKTLAECGKFIVTHKLRKGGVGCEGGRTKTRNRAGDGAFTKGGVLCTVSPLAHGKGEQRERTGHGCSFSNLLLPRYPCIYIVEWLGRASNEILNGPIRWDT